MTTTEAIRQGDHSQFRKVFDEYHSRLYFFILQKTDSAYIAEEVMQLSFIKLWESRHTLKDEFTISTQLFRIATTVLIDVLRKQQRQGISLPIESAAVIEMSAFNASNRLEEKELAQQINDAISDLPPVRRQVFEMSRKQGMTYQEIADKLELSVKTVEAHIYKALKQLKKHTSIWWIVLGKLFF